jgi:oxysterol-binding protein-related protein 9/10/11
MDLEPLNILPKECLPDETQLPMESRKVWEEVSGLIHSKEYSKATRVKQGIEGKQRKDAAVRKEKNEEWIPKYFVTEDIGGRAELTREGREMLETMYVG